MEQQACLIDAPTSNVAEPACPLDFPSLYTQHFDLVWRNLRRLGVPEASLDDALQDVFLVVHRRASEFRGQCSERTWIIGIVLRVAHDYRRSQRRHSARVASYAEQQALIQSVACPSEQAELREAAAMVRSIIEDFEEEERNVFVLVELEEMSLREVAEASRLSLSTCQRRLAAARKAFDAALRRRTQLEGKRAKT